MAECLKGVVLSRGLVYFNQTTFPLFNFKLKFKDFFSKCRTIIFRSWKVCEKSRRITRQILNYAYFKYPSCSLTMVEQRSNENKKDREVEYNGRMPKERGCHADTIYNESSRKGPAEFARVSSTRGANLIGS